MLGFTGFYVPKTVKRVFATPKVVENSVKSSVDLLASGPYYCYGAGFFNVTFVKVGTFTFV